jgi:hypothetical protein
MSLIHWAALLYRIADIFPLNGNVPPAQTTGKNEKQVKQPGGSSTMLRLEKCDKIF